MSAAGRPPHDGNRYPSGKLKPADEIAPALFARLKNDVVRFFRDPRLATQISYLALQGQLTPHQAAAGARFGEIYNRWRRLKRMRSTPKSPSLEGGFGGGADLAEERMSAEQIAALEDAIRKAREDLDRVLEEVPVYPREVHNALLELCVENQPISSLLYPEIRAQLNRIGRLFEARDKRKRRPTRGGLRPLRATTEGKQDKPTVGAKPHQAIMRAVDAVVRKLRPDLDEDGIRQVKDTVAALAARDKFRSQKQGLKDH